MTEEAQVVEILMEAEAYSIREEVIQYSRSLRDDNPKMNRVDAFEVAFSVLLQILEENE
tara:strand:- start:1660 stop:1836 length:177 start_codon:yes stop_codon:yes gene_type:complete